MVRRWSKDVSTRWAPPAGLFKKDAETIAREVLRGHGGDLASSVSSINFYVNRAGSNLSARDRLRLKQAMRIVQEQRTGVQENPIRRRGRHDRQMSRRPLPKAGDPVTDRWSGREGAVVAYEPIDAYRGTMTVRWADGEETMVDPHQVILDESRDASPRRNACDRVGITLMWTDDGRELTDDETSATLTSLMADLADARLSGDLEDYREDEDTDVLREWLYENSPVEVTDELVDFLRGASSRRNAGCGCGSCNCGPDCRCSCCCERVDVLCGCGWGRLNMKVGEIPDNCPVCGMPQGGPRETDED